jgi:hypothetical protein
VSAVTSEPVLFHDFLPAAIGRKVHGLDSDEVRIVLCSTVPVMQTDTLLAGLAQVANGNGYTTNGVTVAVTPPTHLGGVYRLAQANVPTWTASGSGLSFRALVYLNWTATNKNLIQAAFESSQGFLAITNVAQTGTTATLTAAGHGWSNGDTVVSDALQFPRLNGTFTVSGVTTNTVNITAPVSATIASQAVTTGRVIRPSLITRATGETYAVSAGASGALAVGPFGVSLT